MPTLELEVKEGRCEQCKKEGLVWPNGLCMKCVTKNIKAGEFDHIIKAKG